MQQLKLDYDLMPIDSGLFSNQTNRSLDMENNYQADIQIQDESVDHAQELDEEAS